MATQTTNFSITKPAVGDRNWGTTINANMDVIDATVVIKTDTGDPTGVTEPIICINTFDNNIKMYADGGWRTLASW